MKIQTPFAKLHRINGEEVLVNLALVWTIDTWAGGSVLTSVEGPSKLVREKIRAGDDGVLEWDS